MVHRMRHWSACNLFIHRFKPTTSWEKESPFISLQPHKHPSESPLKYRKQLPRYNPNPSLENQSSILLDKAAVIHSPFWKMADCTGIATKSWGSRWHLDFWSPQSLSPSCCRTHNAHPSESECQPATQTFECYQSWHVAIWLTSVRMRGTELHDITEMPTSTLASNTPTWCSPCKSLCENSNRVDYCPEP